METTESATTTEGATTTEANETLDVQGQIAEAIAKFKAELAQEQVRAKEDERLSKLSEDERTKAELERTRKELAAERASFEREKIKYEAAQVLSKRNLPAEFAEYLIAEDNAKTLERITTFEKKYQKAVELAVTERLKGQAPASGGKTVGAGSVQSFLNLIRSEQIKR